MSGGRLGWGSGVDRTLVCNASLLPAAPSSSGCSHLHSTVTCNLSLPFFSLFMSCSVYVLFNIITSCRRVFINDTVLVDKNTQKVANIFFTQMTQDSVHIFEETLLD